MKSLIMLGWSRKPITVFVSIKISSLVCKPSQSVAGTAGFSLRLDAPKPNAPFINSRLGVVEVGAEPIDGSGTRLLAE